MGWLRYYSDEPKDASLLSEKAVWVLDDSTVPIASPGILITSKLGINWVVFLVGLGTWIVHRRRSRGELPQQAYSYME
jgi:hypothetical protein